MAYKFQIAVLYHENFAQTYDPEKHTAHQHSYFSNIYCSVTYTHMPVEELYKNTLDQSQVENLWKV